VDLISSEAKPKISSALADFILASARISFYVRVRIHTKNQQKYLFCSPYTEPSKCEPTLWKELVRFDFTETCKIMQVFLYTKIAEQPVKAIPHQTIQPKDRQDQHPSLRSMQEIT